MSGALRIRRGVGRKWTAADFDSCLVLIDIGASRPAARVCRARRGRPLRRVFRAALRVTAFIHLTSTPIRKEAVGR